MKKILCVLFVVIAVSGLFVSLPVKTEATVHTVFVSVHKTLKYGDRGERVERMQKSLSKLGYYKGNIDGKYGPQTKKAVADFQKRAALQSNGVANNKTLTVLYGKNADKYKIKSVYSVKYTENSTSYYDIGLSKKQQDYVRKICKKYNVSFELVLAVMKVESGYKTNIKSKTNDYGIMQINKCNHSFLRKKLGVSNFLNFEQNTKAGVYMLSRYTAKHTDIHKVLMCYNLGEGAASKKWKKGTVNTSYSRKVVKEIGKLQKK